MASAHPGAAGAGASRRAPCSTALPQRWQITHQSSQSGEQTKSRDETAKREKRASDASTDRDESH